MEHAPYLTPDEAALYLGTTRQSLANDRATRRWGVPFIKFGRKVLYERAALDEFVAAHRVDLLEDAS